jgi:quercetin dioxygenase-like cupin family protein
MAEIDHGENRQRGNPENFTGEVFMTSLSAPPDPSGVSVTAVEFTPGARSKWHSHTAGQVLHILSGEGVVVNREGQRIAMRQGDTVTAAAGEMHWHGATPASSMVQMSITTHGGPHWTGEEIGEDEYRAAVE